MIKIEIPSKSGNTLEDIVDAKWILDCALAGIEETYAVNAPRRLEMERLHAKGYEYLRTVVEDGDFEDHDLHFHNLNWLWEYGVIPEEITCNLRKCV